MCLTFIRVISYSYTLHIPQGVHGANTWSSLDFEFEEDPNKTCCTSVLKLAPPNQNIFLCKILFPIEAILWKKKNPFLKRTAATLQGAVWVIMKKLFQTKLYKFPKKEFYLVFNNNAFLNWSKHLEKGMHFSKDPKAMSQDFKGYCVLLLNSSFPKEIKDECSFQLKQQFWKSHMFLKKHAATLQECCIL